MSMMFSSNQIIEMSGPLDYIEYIKFALKSALILNGSENILNKLKTDTKIVYQIGEKNGTYCIGWAVGNNIKDGWKEYPFDFDLDIVARIIQQHIEKVFRTVKAPINDFGGCDGSTKHGFIMKPAPESYNDCEDAGIVYHSSFYGIIQFLPYWCYYAK